MIDKILVYTLSLLVSLVLICLALGVAPTFLPNLFPVADLKAVSVTSSSLSQAPALVQPAVLSDSSSSSVAVMAEVTEQTSLPSAHPAPPTPFSTPAPVSTGYFGFSQWSKLTHPDPVKFPLTSKFLASQNPSSQGLAVSGRYEVLLTLLRQVDLFYPTVNRPSLNFSGLYAQLSAQLDNPLLASRMAKELLALPGQEEEQNRLATQANSAYTLLLSSSQLQTKNQAKELYAAFQLSPADDTLAPLLAAAEIFPRSLILGVISEKNGATSQPKKFSLAGKDYWQVCLFDKFSNPVEMSVTGPQGVLRDSCFAMQQDKGLDLVRDVAFWHGVYPVALKPPSTISFVWAEKAAQLEDINLLISPLSP